MARRIYEPEAVIDDPRALERRLGHLYRGAVTTWSLEPGTRTYESEKAAGETLAAADDERLSIEKRIKKREELLAAMGRLDRALRHVRSSEAAIARWSDPNWGRS